jgi:transcription initiation factor TFIIH subunit 4
MSVHALDKWARDKWEAILHFMVSNTNDKITAQNIEVAAGTKTLLQVGGFVHLYGSKAKITKEGFSFLLQEANMQVWSLLIVYLENCESVRTTEFRLGTAQVAPQCYNLTLHHSSEWNL